MRRHFYLQGTIMKRSQKQEHEKHVRRIYSQLNKLRKAQQNLGWIELDKPVYLGYIKQFVLRDDVSRRSDAKVYQAILEKINDFATCKTKDFMVKEWKTKKKVPVKHKLKSLSKKEFNKLPSNQQKHFHSDYDHKKKEWRYSFTLDYMFVPKVDKHYAYKVREYDAALEKQEDELYNYIEKNNLWPAINKAMGWKSKCGWDRKEQNDRDNKKKRADMRDVLGELDNKIYRVKI